MLLQIATLTTLVGLAFCASIPANLPAFCHDLDCPEFTVGEAALDFELRHYNETKWVSVFSEGATLDAVISEMFQSLFKYINGENANQVKIAMTAPVLTKVMHGQGPNCASNFTMHFMLPHAMWASPIQPTNPKVTLVTLPPMDVYVQSFGGRAHDTDYTEHVMSLYQSLENKHISVDTTLFFDAGYDGPYSFAHRHNEVWIRKM